MIQDRDSEEHPGQIQHREIGPREQPRVQTAGQAQEQVRQSKVSAAS